MNNHVLLVIFEKAAKFEIVLQIIGGALRVNAGQKYCRMPQGEHSAILSASIKLPFSIKTLVLSIFKWPLKTGFTVQ